MNEAKKIALILLIMISVSDIVAQQRVDSICVPVKKAFVKSAIQLKTHKPQAGLGDYIKVEVTNMDVLLRTSKEKNQKIVLFFNEISMHGIYADFISSHDNSLIFQLNRDTLSMKCWNIFYRGPISEYKKQVRVSVGFENDGAIESAVNNFSLVLVKRNLLIIVILGMIVLFILFIILVKKTGIIRDDDSVMGHEAPYSLSRTQLAFWTFIIVFSFLFIYIITGEIPPINGSTLILLTTSMATAASAKVIDSSKNPEMTLHTEASEGFLKDIISDNNSVSIHRFQMLVWTFILGVIFLRGVVKSLSIPQFDDSMLILMGISSGTYLGLKIPEKNAPLTSGKESSKKEQEEIAQGNSAVV
jgi:hypothetical protein